MASVDARFDNVKVYGITKLDVLLGQEFYLAMHPDNENDVTKWLFYNDPVLDTRVEGNDAILKAAEVGESEIWIFSSSNQKIATVFINVFEEIPEPAVDLGLVIGLPENKGKKKKD